MKEHLGLNAQAYRADLQPIERDTKQLQYDLKKKVLEVFQTPKYKMSKDPKI